MTKIVFDLERFKELLKNLDCGKYIYEIDISESPIAILTCTHIDEGSTVVVLSGRVEK